MLATELPQGRDRKYWVPEGLFIENGAVHVRRHKDVKAAFSSPALSPDYGLQGLDIENAHMTTAFMWFVGGKRHEELRGLVADYFKAPAVRLFGGTIQDIAKQSIRTIVEQGEGKFDVRRDFGSPLAMKVISELMGFEPARQEWLSGHLREYGRRTPEQFFDPAPDNLTAYFWDVILERQRHPQAEKGVLDTIVEAWDSQVITDQEALGYLWGFLAAGHDTTGETIPSTVALIGELGETGMRGASVNLEDTVEESLRIHPVFPGTPTFSKEELRLPSGDIIPADHRVMIWATAANRDEAVNGPDGGPDLQKFIPERSPNNHVTFGGGDHYCLGALLARKTVAHALAAVLELPDVQVNNKNLERQAGLLDEINGVEVIFNQKKAERLLLRSGK